MADEKRLKEIEEYFQLGADLHRAYEHARVGGMSRLMTRDGRDVVVIPAKEYDQLVNFRLEMP